MIEFLIGEAPPKTPSDNRPFFHYVTAKEMLRSLFMKKSRMKIFGTLFATHSLTHSLTHSRITPPCKKREFPSRFSYLTGYVTMRPSRYLPRSLSPWKRYTIYCLDGTALPIHGRGVLNGTRLGLPGRRRSSGRLALSCGDRA
jgi:hypothetical protein